MPGPVDVSADGARPVTAGFDDPVGGWALDVDDSPAMARRALTQTAGKECRRDLHMDDCARDL